MVGAIVKRDLLRHPVVTIRCFGWGVFLRAMLAGPNTTFLSLLTEVEAIRPAEGVAEFVARCVELELKASRIYGSLARRFEENRPVSEFFAALARQETAHAELLELAESAAARERWDESKVTPWRKVVPQLEQYMEQATVGVDEIRTVRDALALTIKIESSEINDVFTGVIAASDSEFVRRFRTFSETEIRHLQFILNGIEKLEPELTGVAREMVRRFAA